MLYFFDIKNIFSIILNVILKKEVLILAQTKQNTSKTVKKIPQSETVAVTYTTKEKIVYKITYNNASGTYSIYEVCKDGFKRLGTGKNPTILEQKHIK